MLDDVASELFSVFSQLSDHCVLPRKLIVYKIKNEKADDNVNDEDEGVISDYESKAEM